MRATAVQLYIVQWSCNDHEPWKDVSQFLCNVAQHIYVQEFATLPSMSAVDWAGLVERAEEEDSRNKRLPAVVHNSCNR